MLPSCRCACVCIGLTPCTGSLNRDRWFTQIFANAFSLTFFVTIEDKMAFVATSLYVIYCCLRIWVCEFLFCHLHVLWQTRLIGLQTGTRVVDCRIRKDCQAHQSSSCHYMRGCPAHLRLHGQSLHWHHLFSDAHLDYSQDQHIRQDHHAAAECPWLQCSIHVGHSFRHHVRLLHPGHHALHRGCHPGGFVASCPFSRCVFHV